MTERAAPMYCPYCGEESLRPWAPDDDPAPDRGRGQWRCDDCTRVFSVRYVGMTGAAGP